MKSHGNSHCIDWLLQAYNLNSSLAQRLEKVMGSGIFHYQNAFVEWRHFLDCCLAVNEIIDSNLKAGFKVDMMKLYNHIHVSWSFLGIIGFVNKWRSGLGRAYSMHSSVILSMALQKGSSSSRIWNKGISSHHSSSPQWPTFLVKWQRYWLRIKILEMCELR